MIQFKRLAIEGFRSFRDDQVLEFPEKKDAFVLIKGLNEVEPDLGANGAGKSSILEALCFVLYGKTSRNLKARDIANREGDTMTSICLEFYKGEVLYNLTRTWNPNSLTLMSNKEVKVVDQKQIDDLIGVDQEAFLRTVYFPQFGQYFLDLTPGAKLLIFSTLLYLDVWDKATDTAKSVVRQKEVESDRELRKLASVEGELTVLLDTYTRVSELAARFEVNKESKEMDLRSILDEQNVLIATAEKELKDLTDGKALVETKLEKVQTRLDNFLLSKKKEEKIKAEVEKSITVIETKASSIEDHFKVLSTLKKDCPTCKQEITSKHKEEIRKTYEKTFDTLHADLDVCNVQLSAVNSRISELGRKYREAETEYDSYSSAIKDVEGRIIRLNNKLLLLRERAARADDDIKELQAKENPYKKQLESIVGQKDDSEERATSHRNKVRQVNQERADAETWQKYFKDIKFWIIETALNELELFTNNALTELGLSGYKISYDIERSKADGSTIRSFQTFITKKDDPDPVPWETFSGGEIQRIRLAGTIGLSDLISARTGFACNAEFWDEPTAHLSQEGITDLLMVLEARSKSRKKQVWLVDHRSLDSGAFDEILTVVKSVAGSKIINPKPRIRPIKVKSLETFKEEKIKK